jgi:hypothetical protein
MNTSDTSTHASTSQQRAAAGTQFLVAHTQIHNAVKNMRDAVRALTDDPAYVMSMGVVLDSMVTANAEMSRMLRVACDHKHWTFKEHGRLCTFGTMMRDFGD